MERPASFDAVLASPAALLVLVLLSTIVGRALTVAAPGLHDAQLFRLIGAGWSAGRVPYRDLWDNKPPGIFALAALASSSGDWALAVAALEASAVIAAVAAVYLLLLRSDRSDRLSAATAAAATAIGLNLSILNEGGFTTELFVAPFAAISMLAFAHAWLGGHRAWWLAAGASAGVAGLFKPPGFAPLIAQACFIGMTLALTSSKTSVAGPAERRGVLQASLLLSLGLAAVWGPVLGYFALHGAARELLNASIFFNLGYAAANQDNPLIALAKLIRLLVPVATLMMGSVVLGAMVLRAPRRNLLEHPLAMLVLLWLFWDVLAVAAGGRFYGHYVLAAVPSMAVATGLCVQRLRRQAVSNRAVRATIAATLLPLLVLQGYEALTRLPSQRQRRPVTYWEAPVSTIRASLARDPAPATLFTWDYLPAVYVHSGLYPPTRYPYVHTHGGAEARDSIARAVLGSFSRTPPTFVVDAGPRAALPGRDTPAFREYQGLLAAGFELVAEDPTYGIRTFRLAAGSVGRAAVKQPVAP